jgi:3-hydroxybutyryl-CoA dehydratase
MTTVYLDALKPGMSASLVHTVGEQHIQLFGEATGDMNPVHFDENFARKTVFRGRVAHGALSVGFISAVIGTKLPGEGTIFAAASLVFKSPVRIGDTVTTICTVREMVGREAIMDCACKVGERLVLEAEARVLVPKRPAAKDHQG